MLTLFINTALKETHVALFDDEKSIDDEMWEGKFHEFDTLIPTIEKLLSRNRLLPADLGNIVVCHGPGGFTSVRLGVSAANALSFALDIPIAKISVFDLLSFLHRDKKDFCVVLQANQSEVYVCGYGEHADFFREPKLVSITEFEKLIGKNCVTVSSYGRQGMQGGALNQNPSDTIQGKQGRRSSSSPQDLEKLRGSFQLPWDKLEFKKQVIEPWYYKEARVTFPKRKYN